MEKYLSLPTIRIVFIVNYGGLDARKCPRQPSQESHIILSSSVGLRLTNKRNSMAYTTCYNGQAGNTQQDPTKHLPASRVAAGGIRLQWQIMCS